ncbi:MAG: ATP-binding protein [Saprospiraceae bacterium]
MEVSSNALCTNSQLKLNPELANVPDDQLDWLLSKAECKIFEVGEKLFSPGQKVEYMHVLLEGNVQLWISRNGSKQTLGYFEAPRITGKLPYSRMKEATGHGEVIERLTVVSLHTDHFPEMIREKYELTEALVHFMTSRVRSFTSQMLQNEKLLSLGKLSAGLSHELNNPASAVVRSAQALKKHLTDLPEAFKNITNINMGDEKVDMGNGLMFAKLASAKTLVELTLMERNELEDDLASFLEEQGADDGYEMAETLAEYQFSVDDLQTIFNETSEAHFLPVLMWIVKNLVTQTMVGEIEEASRRIKDLVSSVKGYTHMDESIDRQAVDIHANLKSTLTIMGFKAKKVGVLIDKQLHVDLPKIMGFSGEINQVFTNLIDNAIDAMESSDEKVLGLKTELCGDQVRILISDTGSGIPEDTINKIFDPFFTTKEIGKGTGLGLDIVQKIITHHKGQITASSSPAGTTFAILLPIA